MRVILGVILGAALTIAGAYLYDSTHALATTSTAQRPMVNWDVVSTKWDHLQTRARTEWTRIAGR
jgi:hypothetical protein